MVAPVVNSPSSCSPSAPNAGVRRAGWTGCSKVSTPSTAVLERVRVERCHIYLGMRRHAGRMARAMATRADGRCRRKVFLRFSGYRKRGSPVRLYSAPLIYRSTRAMLPCACGTSHKQNTKRNGQRVSTLAAGRAMCSCPRGRGWSASTIAPLASTQSHPTFAHEPASKATL